MEGEAGLVEGGLVEGEAGLVVGQAGLVKASPVDANLAEAELVEVEREGVMKVAESPLVLNQNPAEKKHSTQQKLVGYFYPKVWVKTLATQVTHHMGHDN